VPKIKRAKAGGAPRPFTRRRKGRGNNRKPTEEGRGKEKASRGGKPGLGRKRRPDSCGTIRRGADLRRAGAMASGKRETISRDPNWGEPLREADLNGMRVLRNCLRSGEWGAGVRMVRQVEVAAESRGWHARVGGGVSVGGGKTLQVALSGGQKKKKVRACC